MMVFLVRCVAPECEFFGWWLLRGDGSVINHGDTFDQVVTATFDRPETTNPDGRGGTTATLACRGVCHD